VDHKSDGPAPDDGRWEAQTGGGVWADQHSEPGAMEPSPRGMAGAGMNSKRSKDCR